MHKTYTETVPPTSLNEVIRVKVGRDTVIVQIVARVELRNLYRVDDQTIVQARVQVNIGRVAGLVVVHRLETHVVGCGMRVIFRDGGGFDDLARARTVWSTAKDERGVGGKGDVRSAGSGRTSFRRL